MESEFLQYGALGLLALVLIGVSVFLRQYFTQLETSRESYDAFIRGLVDDAVRARNDYISSWRNLTAEMVGALSEVKESISALNKSMVDVAGTVEDVTDCVLRLKDWAQDHDKTSKSYWQEVDGRIAVLEKSVERMKSGDTNARGQR